MRRYRSSTIKRYEYMQNSSWENKIYLKANAVELILIELTRPGHQTDIGRAEIRMKVYWQILA